VFYGGRDEKPHPVLHAIGVVTGAAGGLFVGYCGYLLATFFPHMLHTALPNMTQPWFLGLWAAAISVPVLAFRSVLLHGVGVGTRTYAACGMTIIIVLFVVDLTGVYRVFPWDTRFYIVPAIEAPGNYVRPSTPDSRATSRR
jgi:hypothetical protein